MSRKFLYRRLGSAVIVIVILAYLAAMAPRSVAQRPQLKRPEDAPQEKPPEPKKKKVKGPRAVGLLQLNSSGKGTLVPIAILVDGKFYDASAYKADPVPMALESGTVYEAEQAGESQGLFTISGALHSQNPGSPNPWVGAGSYLPHGAEAVKTTHKAEDVPVGLDSSGDEPPRLSKKGASKPAAASNPSPAPTSSTPAGAGSSEKPGTAAPPASGQPSGGTPPGTSSGTSSGASSGTSAGTSSSPDAQKPAAPSASDKPGDQGAKGPAPAAEKPRDQGSPSQAAPGQTSPGQTSPTQSSPAQAPPVQAPPVQTAPVQAAEEYRPALRRGIPTQSAPEEYVAPVKAGKPGPPGTPGSATTTAASAEPVQLVPAISDESGPDPRPYKFFWKTGEEDDRRTQMLALAGDEVQAYAAALAKNHISANPPAAKPAAVHKAPVKPAPPVFENIQFRTFDVWVNNQPVMILSADAHLPPPAGFAAAPESYSITLVARTDIYGNLRKLYSGVTDKFHLDVTPRLELIDAVDADGDGRGELLFRETSDAGSGYVIYRATADKLWKMFDSLGK
jgi:hypothetical protein